MVGVAVPAFIMVWVIAAKGPADADRCPVSKVEWVWATVCSSKTAPDKCPAGNAMASGKILGKNRTATIWDREDGICLVMKETTSRLPNGAGNKILTFFP